MAGLNAVVPLHDPPAEPVARVPAPDRRNRSRSLLRTVVALALGMVCWALLIAFAGFASADDTTPVGTPSSDAALTGAPTPEGVEQPEAATSVEPGGSEGAGLPAPEAAPPADAGGGTVAVAVASAVVETPAGDTGGGSAAVAVASAVTQPQGPVPDPSTAGTEVPEAPSPEGAEAGAPADAGGGSVAVAVASAVVESPEVGSPPEDGTECPEATAQPAGAVSPEAPPEGGAGGSVAVAVATSVVQTPAAVAGPPGAPPPPVPEAGTSGEAAPEVAGVQAPAGDLPDGDGGAVPPLVELSLEGESGGSAAVAVAYSVAQTPTPVADPSGTEPPSIDPPVDAATEVPSVAPSVPAGTATDAPSDGPAGVAVPDVQVSLEGEPAGPGALTVALPAVPTPMVPPATGPEDRPVPGIGASVDPGGAWVPAVHVSWDTRPGGSVAVAVALAVVQRIVGSTVLDESVAIAVAISAM